MGSCISKKTPSSNSLGPAINIPEIDTRKLNDSVTAQVEFEKRKSVKKEVFVIHHRNPGEDGLDPGSCSKEEVRRRRRMSFGSNPSFDFDAENVVVVGEGEGEGEGEEGRVGLMGSRSGSRRRVSRSPVRRSQSPVVLSGSGSGNEGGVLPGKLVSVPATVTSLSRDDVNVSRVLVQRNVGSPRSQSPAKLCGNGNGNVNVNVNVNVNGRSECRVRGNQVSGNVNGRSQSPIEKNRASGSGSGDVNVNGRSQSSVHGNKRSQSPIEKNRAIESGSGSGSGNGRSQSIIEKNCATGGGNVNVNGRSQSPVIGSVNGRSQSLMKVNEHSQSPIEKNRASGSGNVNGRPVNGNERSQTPIEGNQSSRNVNVDVNGRSQSPIKGNRASGNANVNGRSQSPVMGNAGGNGNEGGWQQHTLSRNGSRKSPYRRTPLNEIDLNLLPFQPLSNKRPLNKGKEIQDDGVMVKQAVSFVSPNKYAADTVSIKSAAHGTHRRTRSRGTEGYEITKTNYCRVDNPHKLNPDQLTGNFDKDQLNASEYDAMVTPVILSGNDTHKLPQTLVRSRSARRSRSRDFDINVDDASLIPTPATNYTSLLLQDIQKFHQNKNSNTNSNTTITLPPCVNKACSIVEAVADLNSSMRTTPSFTFTGDRSVSPMSGNFSFNSSKKIDDHPFVESEVKFEDDLMEPSIHKYVTVRKKGGEDIDDVESYGSNNITGKVGQQNWGFASASWEPNSGESTDCWISKSNTPENEICPVGYQKHAISDLPSGTVNKSEVKCSSKGREQIGTVRPRTPPVITSK